MSSYDPYRFLPNNQPPPSSSIEQIHIPVYAPPDLDPSAPLPEAEYPNSSGKESRHEMAEQSEAGPSRKRPRESEGSNGGNGHGHAPSTGHGHGHNGSTSRRPVEVPQSMFGMDARNDLTREIGTWLVKTCQGRENIEVSCQATEVRISALTRRSKLSLDKSYILAVHMIRRFV
jgi:hypothetical protein